MQVFQGIILASRDRFQGDASSGASAGSPAGPAGYLACLWAHECSRVFCDKMVTHEDKLWTENAIRDLAK